MKKILFFVFLFVACSGGSDPNYYGNDKVDIASENLDALSLDGQSDINASQNDMAVVDGFTDSLVNADQIQVNDLGNDWSTQDEIADVQKDQSGKDLSSDQCSFVGVVTPCYLNEFETVCDPDFTIFKINETARFKIELLDVSNCADGTINAKINFGDGTQQEWVDGDNVTLLHTFNTVGTKTVEIKFYHDDMFNNSVQFELELIAETGNIPPVAICCDDELKDDSGICVYELNVWPPYNFDFTDSFDPDGEIAWYIFDNEGANHVKNDYGEFLTLFIYLDEFKAILTVLDDYDVEDSCEMKIITNSPDNDPPVVKACPDGPDYRDEQGNCLPVELQAGVNYCFNFGTEQTNCDCDNCQLVFPVPAGSYDPDGEIHHIYLFDGEPGLSSWLGSAINQTYLTAIFDEQVEYPNSYISVEDMFMLADKETLPIIVK